MALYAVLLELDNKGIIKLFDYICSEFMITNNIRPYIAIGAFECEREGVIMDFYSGLSQFLEPVEVTFKSVGLFESGSVYLRPELDEKLKSNYYKTYATMSKHFDAGFGGKYLPSKWIPHLTVGYDPCPEEAQQIYKLVDKNFRPFKCRLNTSALARCAPYKVISRAPLVFDGVL